MNAADFIERLDGVKPRTDGEWVACCPAHDDRSPSLAVKEGDDERVLVTCYAGCSTEEVVQALGLELADLFADRAPSNGHHAPRPKATPKQKRPAPPPPEDLPSEDEVSAWQDELLEQPAAIARAQEVKGWDKAALSQLGVGLHEGRLRFPIRDGQGQLVNVVKYKPQAAEGEPKSVALRGRPRGLFPAPEDLGKSNVLLVEGEPDAITAATLGVPAVAVPGVNGWKSEYAARLSGREVVVCMDCDEHGRKASSRIASDLRRAAIVHRVVDLAPDRSDGFDIGDLAKEASTTAEARDRLLALVKTASKVEPSSTERVIEEIQGNGARPATSTLTNFTEIVAKPVRFLWRDRIALGKITALAGRPKIGKGLLYSRLIAELTQGRLEGDLGGPGRAIIVTTEDEPGDTLKPRLMAAGADLSRVSMFQMGSKDEPVPFRVPGDAEELGRRVAESQTALVVIDPLMEFLDEKTDAHKSKSSRHAISAVNQIAREHGCAVLCVFHLNKGVSTDPLLRHEGSAAFTQIVRSGLMLGFDPDDPDGDEGDRRVLAVSSSNLARLASSLAFQIEGRSVEGDTGEPISTAAMRYVGESTAGSHDLLKGHDDDARAERDEATEFLIQELSNGSKFASEVTAGAKALGITPYALKAARNKLGIQSNKDGFQGPWKWGLPEGGDATPLDDVPSDSTSLTSLASRAKSPRPLWGQNAKEVEVEGHDSFGGDATPEPQAKAGANGDDPW